MPKRSQTNPQTNQNEHFWGSWAALGGSWALLGRSWRPSWDQPITRSKTRSLQINGWQGLGSIWEVKMPPKTTPKRSQNESKIKTKNASLFYRSWTHLGPILRRFGTLLGVGKIVFSLVLQRFREHRRFQKRSLQDAFWSQLGSI